MPAHARLAVTFRWVFLAAYIRLLLALVFPALMEERPLRARVAEARRGA